MDSAMAPNTVKHCKRELATDKRRSESARKVKQKAASKRWQFEYMDSNAPDESESSSAQVEVHTKEVEASQPTLAPSSRIIFRLKARLIGLLPSNPVDHLDLFIMSLYGFPAAAAVLHTKTASIMVHCLCTKGVIELNESNVIFLRYWLSKLVSNTLIVSNPDDIGLEVPAELAPRSVAVNKLCQALSALYML